MIFSERCSSACAASRCRGRGGSGLFPVELRVLPQDLLLQASQGGTGVDAEIVGQASAHVRVHGERVRLPAGAVQRHHQQPAQTFAQRVFGDEALGSGHYAPPSQPTT
jgi:hypothetical protein